MCGEISVRSSSDATTWLGQQRRNREKELEGKMGSDMEGDGVRARRVCCVSISCAGHWVKVNVATCSGP